MGMFDWVTCEYPLPGPGRGPERDDGRFQTKSFDNYLDDYRITVGGRLLKHCEEHEPNPDWRAEDAPGADASIWDRLAFSSRATRIAREWEEDVNFHGWMEFGSFESDTGTVHDYRVKFTDGQLVEIEHTSEVISERRGSSEKTPGGDPSP